MINFVLVLINLLLLLVIVVIQIGKDFVKYMVELNLNYFNVLVLVKIIHFLRQVIKIFKNSI